MKTIVIPDVHQRIDQVKSILETEKNYDEIVFLGDWFDSFFEPPQVASFQDTCEYLRYLVMDHPDKNKFVFLVGNHDLTYIYYNNRPSVQSVHKVSDYYCSGFTKSKSKTFRKVFYDEGLRDNFFYKNFKIVYQTQGFIISHAGLNIAHIPYGRKVQDVIDEIIPEVWKNFRDKTRPHNWLISGAGFARGGDCPVGGLLWQDWNNEFFASYDIGKQIVGHTRVFEPSCRAIDTEYESWNLDTERDYAIILDGKVTTKLAPNVAKSIQDLPDHNTVRHD